MKEIIKDASGKTIAYQHVSDYPYTPSKPLVMNSDDYYSPVVPIKNHQ
jgi:hypothetical protein